MPSAVRRRGASAVVEVGQEEAPPAKRRNKGKSPKRAGSTGTNIVAGEVLAKNFEVSDGNFVASATTATAAVALSSDAGDAAEGASSVGKILSIKGRKVARGEAEFNPEERYPKYAEKKLLRADGARKWVGVHVSSSGGVHNSVHNALSIGANSFALFLRSPRRWDGPGLSEDVAETFVKEAAEHGYDHRHIMPHGQYLINLSSPNDETRKKSLEALVDDVRRCDRLGIKLFNFHPGSAAGGDRGTAVQMVADGINHALSETSQVTILIENMAGQGNVLGGPFEDLRDIIALVHDKSRVGVCLDTCHLFAAGHDIRTAESFAAVLKQFDSCVGAKFLRAWHLNDSKTELGSGIDRHENIGKGHIGLEAFRYIMQHPRFDGLPLILETPRHHGEPEAEGKYYRNEVELLYGLLEAAEEATSAGAAAEHER